MEGSSFLQPRQLSRLIDLQNRSDGGALISGRNSVFSCEARIAKWSEKSQPTWFFGEGKHGTSCQILLGKKPQIWAGCQNSQSKSEMLKKVKTNSGRVTVCHNSICFEQHSPCILTKARLLHSDAATFSHAWDCRVHFHMLPPILSYVVSLSRFL